MPARAALMAAGLAAASAWAQQRGAPPPAFAPSNLTPAGVRALAAACAPCHGTDGHAVPGSALQPLAGRPRDEIVQALALFKEGRKPATVMQQIARGFTDEEVAAVAQYFERQPRQEGTP
jgi:cytochrome c553